MPLLWAVAVLLVVLAPFFVYRGFDAAGKMLQAHVHDRAQAQLAGAIRQRRIPPELVTRSEALLARSMLGLNYLTLRNANGVVLLSRGRYQELGSWLPSEQARTLRGFVYRLASADRRMTLRVHGDVAGYMDYGIGLGHIAGTTAPGAWIWLGLWLLAVVVTIGYAAPALDALRALREPPRRASGVVPPRAAAAPTGQTRPEPARDEAVESRERMGALCDRLGIGVLTTDPAGGIQYANAQAARLLRSTPGRLRGQAPDRALTLTDQQGHAFISPLERQLAGTGTGERERGWLHAGDGHALGVEMACAPAPGARGRAATMLIWDVDEAMRTAERTSDSAGLAQVVFADIDEGVAVCDGEARLLQVSERFAAYAGGQADDMPGQLLGRYLPGLSPGVDSEEWQAIETAAGIACEARVRPVLWRSAAAYAVLLRRPPEPQAGASSDQAQRARDPLTSLVPAPALMQHLSAILAEEAAPGCVLLLVVDLVHFKQVNHSFGRTVGDAVLARCAEMLADACGEDGLAARVGGEEFALILPAEDESERDAMQQAQRVRALFAPPLQIDGLTIPLALDIGMAYARAGRDDPDHLLNWAETALYTAKVGGEHAARLYAPDMAYGGADSPQAAALRHALAADALRLGLRAVYREGDTGAVAAALASLEWRPEDDEPVQGMALLAHAQELGLLGELGAWYLRRLGQEYANWRDLGLAPVPMVLPANAALLASASVHAALRTLATRYQFQADGLLFMLQREDCAAVDPEAVRVMAPLPSQAGKSTAAAAFYLAPDVVAALPDDAQAVADARDAIDHARKTNKPLLAGPVDSQEQYNALQAIGVPYVFGDTIGNVLAPRAFGRYLAKRGSAPLPL